MHSMEELKRRMDRKIRELRWYLIKNLAGNAMIIMNCRRLSNGSITHYYPKCNGFVANFWIDTLDVEQIMKGDTK